MRNPNYEIAAALNTLLDQNGSITDSPPFFSSVPKDQSGPYLYFGGVLEPEDEVKDKYVNQVQFTVYVVSPQPRKAASKAQLYAIMADVLEVILPTPTNVLTLADGFSNRGIRVIRQGEDELTNDTGLTYRGILEFEALIEKDL